MNWMGMVFKDLSQTICWSAKEVLLKNWPAIAKNILAIEERTSTCLWTLNQLEEVLNSTLALHTQSNTCAQQANHPKRQDLLTNSAWLALGSGEAAIRINIKTLRTMWVQVKRKEMTAVEAWLVAVIWKMAISASKRMPPHISVTLHSHRNNI